jgi:hypothetical protein
MNEEDEKEFEEWWKEGNPGWELIPPYWSHLYEKDKLAWMEARRTLRDKIKADPSIGKLEVEDWPDNPNY